MLAFLVAGAYFGGGGAYRFHKFGARGSDLLPHQAFWTELRGLVEDGVAFAQARGKLRSRSDSRKGGEYTAVPAAAASEKKTGRRSAEKDRNKSSKGPSSKEKRKKREKKDAEQLDREDAAERAPTPAPAPSPAAAAVSSASGGGGRWIRVPN